MVKIAYVLLLLTPVLCSQLGCNHENAVNKFKRPTYDFSVRLLDRVAQETGYHFVFSPLSTWLQLMTLWEGARGPTAREIRKVTKHHRMLCFRRKYKEILNEVNDEIGFMTKRTNIVIINKLLNVKNSYKNEIQKSNSTKILSLNFEEPHDAAAEANEIVELNMDGIIKESIQAEDFDMTVLLMIETAYFKSDWRSSFNPVYTSTEPFYSNANVSIGNVRLMSQTGYFNITNIPSINAKVVEIPFNANDRISMLIFLPTKDSVQNLVYYLKDIRLTTIFNRFKRDGTKLAIVRIPRINIKTDLENIPELLYDMGVKRIFNPDLADFGDISDFKMYTSLMKQIADIEVTEKGATASAIAEFVIRGNTEEVKVDRPFVYLIVDRKTDIILFGGIYSIPNIY